MEARTKTEKETEIHTLTLEVPLTDGTRGRVFSRNERNEAGVFVYSCHVCNVQSLPGEACLQTHISGRRHCMKMGLKVHDANSFKAQSIPKANVSKIAMDIAPGEPVPPGFENEVCQRANLQNTLDSFKESPLVALEYIMELRPDESEGGEPNYHCILCDKRGDPRTIIAHLTSHNHRVKFLEKHFPSVIREIGPIRFNREALRFRAIHEVVDKVCKSIEDYHGRLIPQVHNARDYEKNKGKILQDVIFDRHFDERTGPKFVETVDKRAIEDFLAKNPEKTDNLLNIPTIEKPTPAPTAASLTIALNLPTLKKSSNGTKKPPASALKVEEKVIEINSDVSSISSGSLSRSRSRSPKRRKITAKKPPPTGGNQRIGAQRKSRSPMGFKRRTTASTDSRVKLNHLESMYEKTPFDRSKTQRCRDEIDSAINDLSTEFKEYQKNPEKHPEYNDEWKKFWNRRYKELQQEKRDPAKYDFKPEWVEFWTKRMKEIHDEDIDRKVNEIKMKYKEKPSSSPVRKRFENERNDRYRSSRSPPQRRSHSRSPRKRSRSRRSRSRSRSRSLSRLRRSRRSRSRRSSSRPHRRSFSPEKAPRHVDPYKNPYADPYAMYARAPPHPYMPSYADPYASYYPPYQKPYAEHPAPAPEPKKPEPEEDDSNEPLTFVSVCRLLTAMEDYLGSLGPKCIDLLSKALALEKVKANSSEDKLLTEDTCVFFETVKEKLKGLISANMVSEKKEKVVKKAIQNIAALIHSVTKKLAERKEEMRQEKEEEFASLISRIKSAMIVQGKTDVTIPQLDSLLDFFLEIAKHNSKARTPLTVKEFLIEKKYIKVEEKPKKDEISAENGNSFDGLSDSDIKTLLQNFKALSSDEQHHLIAYLKKLETTDPTRVKKLRTYCVGMDNNAFAPNDSPRRSPTPVGRIYDQEPNVDPRRPHTQKPMVFDSDDDDDDYNYADLIKETKKNNEDLNSSDPRLAPEPINDPVAAVTKALNSADTQNLIASLMGSLQQSIKPAVPAAPKPNLNDTYHQFLQSTNSYSAPPPPPPPQQQHHIQQQQHQIQQHQMQQQQHQMHQQQQASSNQQKQQIFPIALSQLQHQQQQIQQGQQQVNQSMYTGYQNLNNRQLYNRQPQQQQPPPPQNSQPFYQYYRNQ